MVVVVAVCHCCLSLSSWLIIAVLVLFQIIVVSLLCRPYCCWLLHHSISPYQSLWFIWLLLLQFATAVHHCHHDWLSWLIIAVLVLACFKSLSFHYCAILIVVDCCDCSCQLLFLQNNATITIISVIADVVVCCCVLLSSCLSSWWWLCLFIIKQRQQYNVRTK